MNFSQKKGIKGEFVLVVEGKQQDEIDEENKMLWEGTTIEEHISKLINEGLTKKEAIKKVAKDRGIHKNLVYKLATEL